MDDIDSQLSTANLQSSYGTYVDSSPPTAIENNPGQSDDDPPELHTAAAEPSMVNTAVYNNGEQTDYYDFIQRKDLPKPSERERACLDGQPFNSCSICLSDLEDTTIIQGAEEDAVVQLNKCSHYFHKTCIETAFKTKAQCPNCMTWYAPAMGNQPHGSTMTYDYIYHGWNLGYPDAQGYIQIHYYIPSGVQTDEHPRPGVAYMGTNRMAFLPNNPEGREVLQLLQLAFMRRLTFTVGDSVTTGQQNTVTWNNIHHKTSMFGGPQSYGYPDDTYLARVKEELTAMGIRPELLTANGS